MKISKQKKEKIYEQLLAFIFSKSPQSLFTSQIASEIASDEEFVKRLLNELKEKNLLIEIKKNPKGKIYKRRVRWRLSDQAYKTYQDHQI